MDELDVFEWTSRILTEDQSGLLHSEVHTNPIAVLQLYRTCEAEGTVEGAEPACGSACGVGGGSRRHALRLTHRASLLQLYIARQLYTALRKLTAVELAYSGTT